MRDHALDKRKENSHKDRGEYLTGVGDILQRNPKELCDVLFAANQTQHLGCGLPVVFHVTSVSLFLVSYHLSKMAKEKDPTEHDIFPVVYSHDGKSLFRQILPILPVKCLPEWLKCSMDFCTPYVTEQQKTLHKDYIKYLTHF